MSTDKKVKAYHKPALEIKSTSFSSPVFTLYSSDLNQIRLLLEEKISLAPEFFTNSALLVDIQHLDTKKNTFDLKGFFDLLDEKKLIAIGLSGGSEAQNKLATEHKVPVHTIRGTQITSPQPSIMTETLNTDVEHDEDEENEGQTTSVVENMFLSQPVRSGQRIYSKGDLTVLSHVSAGAEVMAEGNIHVYGSLRGRALAGVQGDTNTHIFCSCLEAELISIAGNYKISEELDNPDYQHPVHVFLEKQSLIINKI